MRAAVVCTYPPRRCGLASYAQDLRQALARDFDLVVCAVDRHSHSYPDDVLVVIDQDVTEDYRRAARVIAENAVDVVLIQHEFGIYGGDGGAHLLTLTRELRNHGIPYLVTLHTVRSSLAPEPRQVLVELLAGADAVTVFTHAARRTVAENQLVEPGRVTVIPHGVPTRLRAVSRLRARPGPGAARDRVSAQLTEVVARTRGGRLLCTFGLLAPGKGLETAIAALPGVLAAHPHTHYVIAGCTHPEVACQQGEAYREMLQRTAVECGVADRVHFIDAFLSTADLALLLGCAEIYLTPYRCRDQSRSGTLTYALAAGCPVVSTDYRYAQTMLATGAGLVVPCGDHEALGTAVSGLLGDSRGLARARLAADRLGSQLVWPAVAARHTVLVRRAVGGPAPWAKRDLGVRPLRLERLRAVVDELGVTRCTEASQPDLAAGHRLDDAARLGIVATGLLALPATELCPMARTVATEWFVSALKFVEAALARSGMHNVRDRSGVWRDEPQLGDHVGRALWGVGTMAAGTNTPALLRERVRALRRKVAAMAGRVTGPRASAYAVLGLTRDDRLTDAERALLASAVDRLDAAWQQGDIRWPWCDDRGDSDDARLPQAMIAAGRRLGDPDLVCRGVKALDRYARQVGLATGDGVVRLATNRWQDPDGARMDVAATVEALAQAYLATGTGHYARLARRAFSWFLCHDRVEQQPLRHPLYHPGYHPVLAYHQAVLALVEAGLAQLPPAEPEVTISEPCPVRPLHVTPDMAR